MSTQFVIIVSSALQRMVNKHPPTTPTLVTRALDKPLPHHPPLK